MYDEYKELFAKPINDHLRIIRLKYLTQKVRTLFYLEAV